jgi:hypothetical protein
MINSSFLIRSFLFLESYADNLYNTIVVLPNKRAKIFLIEALKQVTSNILSPEILSIEDFVQNIAGIRTIDPIELLFEFMKCTCQILKKVINNPLSYL